MDSDDVLFDADANQLKKWRETPQEEKQDRVALHIIKIHNRFAEGDAEMKLMKGSIEEHEERIGDLEDSETERKGGRPYLKAIIGAVCTIIAALILAALLA